MEGGSPDRTTVGSGPELSSASSTEGHHHGSFPMHKQFLCNFVDSEKLTITLKDWLSGCSDESGSLQPFFDVSFSLTELQNFDYALEGVAFQQFLRMPNALYASTSDAVEAIHLAIEDFLHAGVKGLWERFWGHESAMPFSVACIHVGSTSSKFYPVEKVIARGKLDGICATSILWKGSRRNSGKWDQILELALLRPDIWLLMMCQNDGQRLSHEVLGEALFYALRVMLSRSLSKSSTAARNSSCVVWNKLENADWGDVGALQILLATYHSIIQFCGPPKHTLEDLATEHSSRLQCRRFERGLVDNFSSASTSASMVNGNVLFPKVVEVQEEMVDAGPAEETLMLEIERISVNFR
ncbi:hypothetical protein FCM35_KLT07335 [Carex littledalei]|uniref:Uncharacterized protein n=1 Tax=Carex littledalei TaxID=544730 RepID=A0A833QTH6_9POAL|nr:hypothetical protein FCM35_KLT07335 [Carex littledalei]